MQAINEEVEQLLASGGMCPFSRSIRDVSEGIILLQRHMNEITYKNDYRLQPNAVEKIANRNAGADDGSR